MSRTIYGNLTGAAARTEKMDAAIERQTPRKSAYGLCVRCGESIPNPWYHKDGLCDKCKKAPEPKQDIRTVRLADVGTGNRRYCIEVTRNGTTRYYVNQTAKRAATIRNSTQAILYSGGLRIAK